MCNLHSVKIAVHIMQFVHAGVWVVGGQMEGRVSVQRSGDRVPRKERKEQEEGSLLNCSAIIYALHSS